MSCTYWKAPRALVLLLKEVRERAHTILGMHPIWIGMESHIDGTPGFLDGFKYLGAKEFCFIQSWHHLCEFLRDSHLIGSNDIILPIRFRFD